MWLFIFSFYDLSYMLIRKLKSFFNYRKNNFANQQGYELDRKITAIIKNVLQPSYTLALFSVCDGGIFKLLLNLIIV